MIFNENVHLVETWPAIVLEKFDLVKCIQMFDAGWPAIRIKDVQGNYSGNVILKKNFAHYWDHWDISDCITAEVVVNDGIQDAIRSDDQYEFVWEAISIAAARNYFKLYDCIYLSSRMDLNLNNLYKMFGNTCNIRILDVTLIENNSFSESDLLIYSAKIHPKRKMKQVHYKKIYQELVKATKNEIEKTFEIKSSWTSVEQKDINTISLVERFDLGYETVCIEDSSHHFIASISRQQFKNDFPIIHYKNFTTISVEYNNDIIKMNKLLTMLFFQNNLEEIPILKEGKVVGIASIVHKKELSLEWNYIEDYTVISYLANYRKILISSLEGNNKKFYEKYKDHLDLTICDENSLTEYYAGKYDLLICEADLWTETTSQVMCIERVYLNLIAKVGIDFLKSNKIEYYFFDIPDSRVYSSYTRLSKRDKIITSNVVKKNNYYMLCDYHDNTCNITCGRRHTTDTPHTYDHTIYFYGPCTASGLFVEDELTIESFLQRRINTVKSNSFRIVNNGAMGYHCTLYNDINSWYMILNTRFHKEDIVIHMGQNSWKDNSIGEMNQYYDCSYILNRKKELACFIHGNPAHFDELGNENIANYMFEVLEKKIINSKTSHNKKICRFLEENYQTVIDSDLEEYLARLEEQKFPNVEGAVIGSIVMNCNPFTLGHLHLVEQSLSIVDYLYIFIVEEDKSKFSFQDRYQIAQLCCQRFRNVKVIPSGKFIISSLTFAEYFNKDALQETVISPTLDIELFGEKIVPLLGIAHRFVGEEPIDNVTAQYNCALQEILPEYNVCVTEIPRYCIEKQIISASYVRKLLKTHNQEKIRKYLPEECFNYIINSIEILGED